MQSKAYLSVFGLSFAGGLLAPRSSSATGTITWTSRIPSSPILLSLSGLSLVLVSLFALTYLLISGFTFVSGDAKRSRALGQAARRVSRHVLKATLFERACFLLRRAAIVSSTHLQDLLDVPGAVEQFDFWVSCSVYYLAFLGLETVWGQVLLRAKARDDWNENKASQDAHEKQLLEASTSQPSSSSGKLASSPNYHYDLSILGLLPHSGASESDKTDDPKVRLLYSSLVNVDALRSVVLAVNIDGVEYALPTVDLRTLADKSGKRDGNPVQVRIPVELPVGRVILFVVLAPAQRDEEAGRHEDLEDAHDLTGNERDADAADTMGSRVVRIPIGDAPPTDSASLAAMDLLTGSPPILDGSVSLVDDDMFSPAGEPTSSGNISDKERTLSKCLRTKDDSAPGGHTQPPRNSVEAKFVESLILSSELLSSLSSSSISSVVSTPSPSKTCLYHLDMTAPGPR